MIRAHRRRGGPPDPDGASGTYGHPGNEALAINDLCVDTPAEWQDRMPSVGLQARRAAVMARPGKLEDRKDDMTTTLPRASSRWCPGGAGASRTLWSRDHLDNPSRARPNDTAVFYILEPLGSFVATGLVRSPPRWQPPGRPWAGHHVASIRDIRMLGMFRHRRAVAADVPGWGWLRAPRYGPHFQ